MSIYEVQPDWVPILSHSLSNPSPTRDLSKDFSGTSNHNLMVDICTAKVAKPCNEDRIRDMVHELNVRVHDALGRFFPFPADFMNILDTTNSVVSGSWVLAFILEPTAWMAKDLDVYVPSGLPGQVMEYFLETIGYERSNTFDGLAASYLPDSHALLCVNHVVTWKHAGLGTSIDVVHSMTEFAIDVLHGFHSTVVMNFLSSSHLVVMFPDTTLHGKSFSVPTISDSVRSKYAGRGFAICTSNADAAAPCDTACPSLVRSVFHPKSCLAAPLDPHYIHLRPPVAPLSKFWTAPIKCRNPGCINNIFIKMGGNE